MSTNMQVFRAKICGYIQTNTRVALQSGTGSWANHRTITVSGEQTYVLACPELNFDDPGVEYFRMCYVRL